ncbi:MAG: helix-turn-helix transcriptional regulator [Marivibrio sp.]|uniref:helix-turn-helix transcriptional regulator n=1 Tax=Marivibrio sp. TaxID=2039719 RepID=UPI0032ED4412
MTTDEVAAYLRIKERKVYDLVKSGKIPCTRVTGKLLFPKPLIDLWVAAETAGGPGLAAAPRPPIAAGSHDPLLAWALSECGAGIATLFDGSLSGIERYIGREALFCGFHLPPEAESESAPGGAPKLLADAQAAAGATVVIEWAKRVQGLILPAGNPARVRGLAELGERRLKVKLRQPEAGSRMLFDALLGAAGVAPGAVQAADPIARTETDAASAVAEGRADLAFGVESAARRFGLDFLPLADERYDIAIDRRDYFEPPFQKLLAFAAGPRFVDEAARLGGYDVSALGRVVFNG